MTSFTLAVNRRFSYKSGEESQADFFNVTAWRQTAEFITRYFRKASSICVVGSIQTRSWEKDGQKRFATEIVADEAYFVDAKNEAPMAVQQMSNEKPYILDSYMQAPAPKFEEISDDEELPF